MPIQKSGTMCKPEEKASDPEPEPQPQPPSASNSMTRDEALLLLRQKEVLAYQHLCDVFRAQGHLTPEKLKLLKDVAHALYIPEVRHKASCAIAVADERLEKIADCVAGPGTEVEWRRESRYQFVPPAPVYISSASLRLANAVAQAYNEERRKLGDIPPNTVVEGTLRIRSSILEEDYVEPENLKKPKVKVETLVKIEEKEDADSGKEDDDGDTSSSVSSASEEEAETKEEEKNKTEVEKPEITKEEEDATLMPPPPPVIVIPSPTQISPSQPSPTHVSPSLPLSTASPYSPTPPVITVPPPSEMNVVTAPTTGMFDIPGIVGNPVSELSEEEAQARADFLSSLPPLVVVPPPDPSETTVLHSPSNQPPSMVLSPGISIQIRDDTKKRKRTLSHSQDVGAVTPAKSLALSSYSKMTPVMVTAAPISTQPQVKVTPIISRAKMATPGTTQKVIIVSNTPTSNAPVLQRQLGVPVGSLGLPIIRANQPRLQSVTAPATSGTSVRPKVVTVPARCRPKGSSVVNLQLKNTITLKQDNVTVVDTNMKRLPGQTKILPKPSGSMFIVNTGQGGQKLTTAVGGSREGGKQNVVIVQKGANQRTLTLSNPNKDLMQKLMSKKCVVIQSSKVMPKTMSPKLSQPSPSQSQTTPQQPQQPQKPQPQPQQPQPQRQLQQTEMQPLSQLLPPTSSAITTAGNTVVLDLSQEQYRQNLGGSTVRDILQAAGVVFQPTTSVTEAPRTSPGEGDWLPVETTKSLSLEEVSLPLGQSESFVTLDEAVGMLEDQPAEVPVSEGEEAFTPDSSGQVITIASDQLSSGNVGVLGDKTEPMPNQIVLQALPTEVAADLECISQSLMPHKDGAVTIQHSSIDVPTNMSLEDYSSQQMED